MNQKTFEIQKDYAEFMQAVNKAISEQKMTGQVSYDTH
jgi:hypothetical protein